MFVNNNCKVKQKNRFRIANFHPESLWYNSKLIYIAVKANNNKLAKLTYTVYTASPGCKEITYKVHCKHAIKLYSTEKVYVVK